MAEQQRCMGCMSPLSEEDHKCPHCGYPATGVNPPEYLRVRTVLADRYLVGRVLEVSGDSAVYIALDRQDNSTVTIREFFPSTLSARDDNGRLQILGGCESTFEDYKLKFLSNARAVARLRDVLVVVPSFDIFEEGVTAYSVSEYCEGVSLERYVREKGPQSYEQVRQFFLPLIAAMSTIHAAGVMHLGICPKNVLVDRFGHLRLKNFCIPETHTVNTECKPSLIPGYSAPEQYEFDTMCTPSADVYGLAATLFYALTGKHPAEASQRVRRGDDLMMPAEVVDSLPAHVKESLYRAMRVSAERRTQTAQQLLDELTASSAVAALIDEENEKTPVNSSPKTRRKKKRSYLGLIFFGMVIALAVLAFFALYGLGYINFDDGSTTSSTTRQPGITMSPTTSVHIVTKATGTATYTVENLVGKHIDEVRGMTLPGEMTVELKGKEYSDAPVGTILSQEIAPGTQTTGLGLVIRVIVSAGPLEQPMIDMTGWPADFARLYLEALGYRVGEDLLLQVSTYDKGLVEKTQPAAGEPIKFGDEIILWVSDVEQADTGNGGIEE